MASSNISNVGFGAPNDYSVEMADIERRRRLAEALQAQGMAPMGGTEMAGGWAIKKSPFEGLGKIAQAYAGASQHDEISQRGREIGEKYQSDLADTLMRAQQAGSGTPEVPAQPRQGPTMDDEGNAMPGVAYQAPVAGNRAEMARILMQHPATQQMGLQQSMQDANIARMAEAFGYGGQSATPAAGAQPAPNGQAPQGGSPVAQAANAGIPRNIAMGLLLADSSGKLLAEKIAAAYAEGTKPINVRPGGTVYVPGSGPQFTAPNNGMQTTWTGGQPQASIVPGAGDAAGAQAEAVSAGTQAGQAPYQVSTVNTEGAPTLMTRQQQIEQATGKPMPRPGAPIPPSSVVSPAPANASASANASLQANLARIDAEMNRPGQTPRNIAILQKERDALTSGAPQRPPGLRLQDQGDAATQRKFGEERGQMEATAPQARAAVADATTNLQRMETAARTIMNSPALSRITGLPGVFWNMPGSGAADLSAELESLKSQVGFSVLQAMRDASKTGGALGAISDRENELLQKNLAALDKSQSVEGMKRSLSQLIDYAQGAQQRIQRGYTDTYERVLGNQGMRPTPLGAQPLASEPVLNRTMPANDRRAEPRTGKRIVVTY